MVKQYPRGSWRPTTPLVWNWPKSVYLHKHLANSKCQTHYSYTIAAYVRFLFILCNTSELLHCPNSPLGKNPGAQVAGGIFLDKALNLIDTKITQTMWRTIKISFRWNLHSMYYLNNAKWLCTDCMEDLWIARLLRIPISSPRHRAWQGYLV